MIILAFYHPMPNMRVCTLLELSQATSNTLLVQCFQAPSSQPLDSFGNLSLLGYLGEQGLSSRHPFGCQGAMHEPVYMVTMCIDDCARALCIWPHPARC